jgi:F-type H+-transporting ATPase subunit b
MIRAAFALILFATPALAAGDKPFFSLKNTDFVVLLGFLVFLGILLYFKVPGMLAGLLDKRAEGIRKDLAEARAIREEAEKLLASYEAKEREVAGQAQRIVIQAREEAKLAAEEAKAALEASIARRLQAADEQIASAEANALRQVRDRAAEIAVAAAGEAVARAMGPVEADALIGQAIAEAGAKLN